MIIYILGYRDTTFLAYDLENHIRYDIPLLKAYDLGTGTVDIKDVEYNKLYGRSVGVTDHYLRYCEFVIPCGAYMFNCLKNKVIRLNMKLDYTLDEIKGFWSNEDISINRIAEVLSIDIINTRRLVKAWEDNLEYEHITYLKEKPSKN